MKRRQALQRVAMYMGTAVSAPTLFALLQGCKNPENSEAASFVLNPNQQSLLADLAEIIIPKTTTAGAKEAGVGSFIETLIRDCYSVSQQKSFTNGLTQTMELAKEKGNDFSKLSNEDQIDIVKKLELSAKEEINNKNNKAKEVDIESGIVKEDLGEKETTPFFNLLKELTVFGYFNSEKGILENLNYVPIPGMYDGCLEVDSTTKPYVS